MLATVLFSAAFTTGDTLTKSLRTQALENIGRVDVVVKAEQPESDDGAPFGPGAGGPAAPEARESYFDGIARRQDPGPPRGRRERRWRSPARQRDRARDFPGDGPLRAAGGRARHGRGLDEGLRRPQDRFGEDPRPRGSRGERDLPEREDRRRAGRWCGRRDRGVPGQARHGDRSETPPEPASQRRPGATQGPPGGLRAGIPRGVREPERVLAETGG